MSYFDSPKQRRAILDRLRVQLAEEKDAKLLAELNFSDWDDAFDYLNATYWNGVLPKIPVSAEYTGAPRLGWFGHSGYIKLSSNKGMSPKQMLGVLLHEMCHHSIHEGYGHGKPNGRGGRVIGHGKEWKAEMRRVGYAGKITKYSGQERFC
jgi:hypothetical protein